MLFPGKPFNLSKTSTADAIAPISVAERPVLQVLQAAIHAVPLSTRVAPEMLVYGFCDAACSRHAFCSQTTAQCGDPARCFTTLPPYVSPVLLLQHTSKPEVSAVTVQEYSRLKVTSNCGAPCRDSNQFHHAPTISPKSGLIQPQTHSSCCFLDAGQGRTRGSW